MTFQVNLRADAARLNRDLGALNRDIINKAIPRALNVGIRKTRTALVKQLTQRRQLKRQRDIRSRTRVSRASARKARATLWFSPRGLNPVKLGMSPEEAAKYYSGDAAGRPFRMQFPNGSPRIAVRKGKSRTSIGEDSKGRPRRNRLPVDPIRVPIGREGVELSQRLLNTVGREAFIKEYDRQIGLIRQRR